jgi:lysophospholipase L1-like esterase
VRPGLVALGDSITNGEGTPMLGVRAWSWAQWLASALDLPYSGLATNGARVDDVLREQVPRLDGPYAIGCLYVGVNDVRGVDFVLEPYAAALREVIDAVAAACERVVMATIPLDLGRPRAGAAKVAGANRVIVAEASRVGAAVVDLAELRGWRLVLPDAVHLTAAGQIELADHAAAALGVGARPSALGEVDRTVRGAARYAVTAHAAALARDLRRRAVEGAARRLRR